MNRPNRYYAEKDLWEELMEKVRPAKLQEPQEDE